MIVWHRMLVMFFAVTLLTVDYAALPGPAISAEDGMASSEYELLRSDIRTKKMTLLAERMEFSSKEADAFWPIYRKYEVELAAINDKKVALLTDYLQSHKTLDDAKANEISQRVFDADQMTLDLRKKYFQEVARATSPRTAARFIQIERRLQQLVDVQLASESPAIKK